MNEIYQGDNGTLLSLTITNEESVIDLTDSTVEVVIKYKRTGIKKEATITDATNGKCQITLNAEDVNYEGVYTLQATVTYLNGNTFTSNVQRFTVNKKIGYVPVIGGTTGDVGDSSINGNIILNGQEIKVYDDTSLKSLIAAKQPTGDYATRTELSNGLSLKADITQLHSHTNKSTLDKLTDDGVNLLFNGLALGNGGAGSTVSDSATNGNILVNGQELNVYNDNELRQITAILSRIGISTSGKLVIDGVEQTGSGGEEMTLVVKDYFEGNANITKTYTDSMVGFEIANDAASGGSQLTFTINNLTIPVKAQEVYSANFDPYKSVTITTTVPFRATVSSPLNGTVTPSTPTNTAPSITSSYSTTSVNDSTSISIPYTVTDSEGGSLTATLTKDGVATIATISTGSNTWNVGTLSAGSHTLTIQVKDSGNLTSNTLTFNLTVSVTNTAPTITSSYSTTSAFSNDVITIPYTITDSQGGTLTATYTKDGVTSTASVSTGANTWSVGTLAVGSHTLTIKVADNGGLNSNTLTFNITVTASADTTAPTDVSGLSAGTATINSIPISWALSPSGDVANYEVAYSSNGGTNWTVASALVNSSSTSYTITGLVAGTNYTIRVVAIDTSSNRSTGVTITKSTSASVNYVLSATPSTGSYNTTQNVVLSTNPAGATIYYTTNGTTPTTASSIYSTAIPVSANTTIKFFAQDSVGNVSSVQTATYTIDTVAPTVTVTPNAGTYGSAQTVTISSNEGTIYYTTDGSTPTTGSTVYSTPFSVSSTSTVKYLVIDAAGNQTTGLVAYTIDTVAPDPVTLLAVGTVTQTTIPVTWTAPSATDVSKYEVAYSSNGGNTYVIATSNLTAPATSYTVTGLTTSTSYIVRVVAIDGVGNRSTNATVSTTTSAPPDVTAPVLTITPAATFTDTQTVTMSATDANTFTIWYTDDSTDPLTSGTKKQYTAPITLSNSTTIKAYAVDSASNASAVQTVAYTKQIPVTVLASDDFNRVDATTLGTSDSYAGGTNLPYLLSGTGAVFSIVSNQAKQTGGSACSAVLDVAQADVTVQVTLGIQDSGGNYGCVARWDTTNNSGLVFHATNKKIYTYVSGAYTSIGDASQSFVAGDVVKMTLKGQNITLYRNGTQVATATSAVNQTATKHGIGNFGASTATWDNLIITSS
jgi:hypothetical protein